jgi:hypothetical protein
MRHRPRAARARPPARALYPPSGLPLAQPAGGPRPPDSHEGRDATPTPQRARRAPRPAWGAGLGARGGAKPGPRRARLARAAARAACRAPLRAAPGAPPASLFNVILRERRPCANADPPARGARWPKHATHPPAPRRRGAGGCTLAARPRARCTLFQLLARGGGRLGGPPGLPARPSWHPPDCSGRPAAVTARGWCVLLGRACGLQRERRAGPAHARARSARPLPCRTRPIIRSRMRCPAPQPGPSAAGPGRRRQPQGRRQRRLSGQAGASDMIWPESARRARSRPAAQPHRARKLKPGLDAVEQVRAAADEPARRGEARGSGRQDLRRAPAAARSPP